MLAPGERAPRHLAVDVHREGRVAARAALDPRPLRRGDDLARLDAHLLERDPLVLAVGRRGRRARCRCAARAAGSPRRRAGRSSCPTGGRSPRPRASRSAAAGGRRRRRRARCRCGAAGPRPPASGFQEMPFQAMPAFSTSGPSAVILSCDDAVVALDDDELRHRPPGDGLALAGLPVAHHAARLGELLGRVVEQRRGDEVAAHAEVLLRPAPGSARRRPRRRPSRCAPPTAAGPPGRTRARTGGGPCWRCRASRTRSPRAGRCPSRAPTRSCGSRSS